MTRYCIHMMFACLLIFSACRKKGDKQFSERITLKQKHKIPYGTSAARDLMPSLFSGATFYNDDQAPGNWDVVNTVSPNQAVLIMAINFNADEEELHQLNYFASNGNYVYIIAKSFSEEAEKFFNFSYSGNSFEFYSDYVSDSLFVKFEQPAFYNINNYTYPGKKFASSFSSINPNFAAVLGRDKDNNPNFIEYKTGNGRIFIHCAPLAFSNYFVLHKNNVEYFSHALSVIPPGIETFVWNEYYLSGGAGKSNSGNKNAEDGESSWYDVLFRYPAFKWGLLLALFLLILYALLNSRRKQRKIPFHNKPQNDSLDFVKTLGRLYHDRRDHQNLARKMTLYFLEHVRSTFKLPTHTLDENFIRALQYKSGFPAEDLEKIFSFINYIKQDGQVNEQQLSSFHKQLETFYQTT